VEVDLSDKRIDGAAVAVLTKALTTNNTLTKVSHERQHLLRVAVKCRPGAVGTHAPDVCLFRLRSSILVATSSAMQVLRHSRKALRPAVH